MLRGNWLRVRYAGGGGKRLPGEFTGAACI